MNDELLHMVTHFYPIRLIAFRRNFVEMEIVVSNKGNEAYWVETDIEVPSAISLAPDRHISRGRARIGIVFPNGIISKRIKIYGTPGSYPDQYPIKMTFYGYNSKGVISVRTEKKAVLRCERL